ncbi:MAG: segregation/condensation protein A [Myxococcota bacterium]
MDLAVSSAAPFTVHTDVFDGPLDLLLHLVKREGISLARLQISRIADEYLVYLDRMRSLDLSIAADWLVMAATLIHLKALELLPRPPSILAEDDADPREQLLEQLREYERIKDAAQRLDGLVLVGRDVFTAVGEKPPEGNRPFVSPVDAFGLLDVLYDVLARGSAPEPTFRLAESGPNIGVCCHRVIALLGGIGGAFDLGWMLRTLGSRAERVITFIAVLEMCRLGWLDVLQEQHLGPVSVQQLVETDQIDVDRIMGTEGKPGEQLDLPLGEAAEPRPSSTEAFGGRDAT